jgi:DNA ligase D-like protein (predicted 3'-phosphoesterase)
MSAARNKLDIYRNRRNLAQSGEPAGKIGKCSKSPLFVIQKHDASHLHYDVRLEIDGVLVSWAVPKGPSISSRVKRLAMPTDDHPLEYADFEGVIPQGYGAGTVMVWDIGSYKNLKSHAMQKCLEEGRIEIFLDGKKLRGAFALIRMQKPRKGWLLIKMRDEYANTWQVAKKNRDRSALTGRTMRQIAREED